MKTLYLTLLMALAIVPLYAQKKHVQKIGYIHSNGAPAKDSASASCYRTVETKGNIYVVRDYYLKTRILQMEAECSEYTPKTVFHGTVRYYRTDGSIKQEFTYKDGDMAGPYINYYESGKREERVEYLKEGGAYYHQVWSEDDGRELLVDGNGILTAKDDDGATIYTSVRNHRLASCYKFNGADTIKLEVEKQAEYPGGLSVLGQDIGSKLVYPTSARRQGVQGTVFVSFVITKAGDIKDVDVVKGISDECDKEAIRVVKALKHWTPGIQRGKIVNSRFVLPIKFRLSR